MSERVYLYRAVDKFGNTIDFMLSQKRDKPAATRFFTQAIGHAGLPEKIVIDKSGANTAGINAINEQLSAVGLLAFAITMIQSKYLNNIVEQDHRFIKKITRPILGFKSFARAEATLARIELHHISLVLANIMGGGVYLLHYISFPNQITLLVAQVAPGGVLYIFLCRLFNLPSFMEDVEMTVAKQQALRRVHQESSKRIP